MQKPSTLETFASHPLTQSVLSAASTVAASPILAPLVPMLINCLATGRYQERVGKAIAEIEENLAFMQEQLKNITDPQYKLLNETILAIFQTVEEEKFQYLVKAVKNTISSEIEHSDASILARILRDISASEVVYLKMVSAPNQPTSTHVNLANAIKAYSQDISTQYLMSLQSLGLISLDTQMGGQGFFITPQGIKLLDLLK